MVTWNPLEKLNFNNLVSDLGTIDDRALATFRIFIGLFVILTCANHILHYQALHSELGVFPRWSRESDLAIDSTTRGTDSLWSIFFLSASPLFAVSILLLGVAAGVCLMLGVLSRLTTIICWIIIASLRARNPYCGDGGDALLVILLFWGIFLPLDLRISLTRKPKLSATSKILRDFSSQKSSHRVRSLATFCILLQICFVYWFASLEKYDPTWRQTGLALEEALRIRSLTRGSADLLLQLRQILPALSHMVLIIEEVAPFFVFFLPHESKLRAVAAGLLITLHISIAVFFSFGIFPFVAMTACSLFLPGRFWSKVELCTARIRNFSRYRIGVKDQSTRSTKSYRPKTGILCKILSIFINYLPLPTIIVIFWWNATTIPFEDFRVKMPVSLKRFVFALHLNQHWGFFAPRVNTREGFMAGQFIDKAGNVVNFDWQGRPLRPDSLHRETLRTYYSSKLWRQHMSYIFHSRKPELVDAYSEWIERRVRHNFQEDVVKDLVILFFLYDNRFYPEPLTRVKISPYQRVDNDGKILFWGDARRNLKFEAESPPD